MVGVPLHHGAALLQVDGLVVYAGYPILGMGELCLDVFLSKAMLAQGSGGDMAETVASLPAFVTHTAQGHVKGHVATRLGAVITAGEQLGINPGHSV
ncbi:hypothetical protein D9M68_654380 [compost metagenome]